MNPNEARQIAYLQLVEALIKCPAHLEEELLRLNSELVDLGLVMTLLAVAQKMIDHNDPRAKSTIEWLVEYAQRIAQTLGLDMGESPAEDDEEYARFVMQLLQTVHDSEGEEAIVHAFLEDRLSYLNKHLLAIFPQQIDELLTLKKEPEWKIFVASDLHNLAVDLGQFTSGNRSINLELAIICYDRALSVFDRSNFPEEWAMTQINLANTYRDRIEGDRTANLELAIEGYQAALEVLTPRKYPIESGRIQTTLEATIELRDTLAQRDRHHPDIYEIETLNFSASDSQLTQMQLVDELLECPQGEEDRLLAAHPELVDKGLVIELLSTAQMMIDRNDPVTRSTIEWLINFAQQLAQKLGLNIDASSQSDDKEYDRFFRELLQAVINSQGNGRIVHEFFDNHLSYLDEKLLANLPQQVEILLARKDESDWKLFVASILNSLAIDLCQFPRGNRSINLELSIECYRLALEVRTRAAYPEDWAMTQMNLANAYSDRIRGERAANLEQSIECYRLALEVRTRAAFPEQWATTQMNLAVAYSDRIRGERAANLEQSIECYRLALEVYTRAAFPEDWAKTQMNLATAYQTRIRGERAANLEQSIECYRLALEVYTRAAYPEQWATTQMNLAIAYRSRIRGERAANLEQSIECYRLALEVYTRAAYPEDWATTQMNLAVTYKDRIRGERAANLEQSIAFYKSALEVFTPAAYPEYCLTTARNLGNLHYEIDNWQPAIDAYETAMQAIETSRSWALNDESRQELSKNALSIYENAIQCAINLQNYSQAIQFTERIRSRSLVELMEAKDLYADAQLPQEIDIYLTEYQDINHQIQSQRQQLQSQHQPSDALGDNTTHPVSRDPDYFTNLTATITTLERQKAQVYNQLRQLDPVLAGEIQVQTIDFASIQQLITTPHTAILTCYTTDDDTHIFIIKQSGAPTIHTCKNQGWAEFQQWLQTEWIDLYHTDLPNWEQNLAHRLHDIAKRLQLNTLITTHLTDINELIIVPHLNLHQIPFAALPITSASLSSAPLTERSRSEGSQTSLSERSQTDEQGQADPGAQTNPLLGGVPKGRGGSRVPEEQGEFLLNDRFLIRSIPSCQILQYCNNRPTINTAVIGTVEDAENNLLGARYEGAQIAALYNIPPTNRLIGSSQATAANYRDLLTRVNRLQSSHHATIRPDNPLESALILAQGETITLSDLLMGTRYPNLDEVFLSACETNVGTTTITDDIATLTTGFLSIGARSVQSTLWAVDDIATVIFSLFYHQQRKQKGNNRVISLRTAQQQLRNLTGTQFAQYHPRIIEYFNTHSPALISSLQDRIANLIKQQSTLDLNTQKGTWNELQANINKLESELESIETIPCNSEDYCDLDRPFEHPFYWAAFITQGMA